MAGMPGTMPHALAVNPATGFMDSQDYAFTFDGERKRQFLERYRANGLMFRKTCKELGISMHTVNKHYQLDPKFKEEYDECQREYAESLESFQRDMALTPKGFMDRCMQLRHLFPDRYAPEKQSSGPSHVVINITADALGQITERQRTLDAQIVGPEHSLEHTPTAPPSTSDSISELQTGEEAAPDGRS